jgi:hypothetical protein
VIANALPPTWRDPNGIHAAIWSDLHDEPFTLPSDKPLTLASYECGRRIRAYIDPIAVGDALPEMALFLGED